MMNVLLIGSGGREHAFAWKLRQSPLCQDLYIAPGNAGTAREGKNVALDLNNFEQVGQFAQDKNINLVLVGPEVPLAQGLRDHFESHDALQSILFVGPGQKGAQLESSKDFSKAFMREYNIPCARSESFTAGTLEEGIRYLTQVKPPYVLKADGLAAGKGVIITEDLSQAQHTLREMLLNQKFGQASQTVLIEDYMQGIEVSVFVLTDGISYKILPEAKDYKRIGKGDTGLNTGGMGAVSPVPFADAEFLQKVESRIVQPTLAGLKDRGIDYVGFLFIGLMNVQGDPYVIEYNVRMGDPETQVVMPRIDSDLLELLQATAQKSLAEVDLKIRAESASTVVLVSGGYPEAYEKGKVIRGLEEASDVLVFHAGTLEKNTEILSNGGRVLALTGIGPDKSSALQASLAAAQQIDFEGKYYRDDIGFDL